MKNNIRERLIDLLEQAEGQVNNDIPSLEMIADYLIASGVMLPPSKVGDTVYIHFLSIRNAMTTIRSRKVREIIYKNNQWYVVTEGDGLCRQLDKDFFVNIDRAEEKLKEMRVDNGNL